MKKLVIAALLSVSLAGCATTGGIDPTKANALIAQVQAITQQACGYLPTASSVANIAASFISGGTLIAGGVEALAGQICAAVTAKKGRFGSHSVIRVHGVPLHGRFVR